MRGWSLLSVVVSGLLAVNGCGGAGKGAASSRTATPAVPLGIQMVKTDAQMRKYPFRTLLDFELPNDTVFVRAEGATPRLDSGKSHTGANSLVLDSGCKSLTVRMASLTSGTSFPGRWTLIGAYLFAPNVQRVTASYEVEGVLPAVVNVEIPGGQWTPVLLDLSALVDAQPAAKQKVGVLKFAFPDGLKEAVHCDNVVVVDNTQTLVAGTEGTYSVKERGFAYYIERPNPRGGYMFKVALKTPEASQSGWRMKEANAVRSWFTSPAEEGKSVLFYSDGRVFREGKYDVLGNEPRTKESLALQHASPAQVNVTNELGRVVRTSAGDANNDGYCEGTGVYKVEATGPRVELIVTPRTPVLVRPVIEISGLPEGKVVATMEGRLVEKVVRVEGGRTLIELPGAVDRATQVSVRVTQ